MNRESVGRLAMQAEQFIKEARLDDALAAAQDAARGDPSNPEFRALLYQLFCVRGEWDRALTQINVLGDLKPKDLIMVEFYRNAIQCEALRDAVFAGKRTPLMLGEPAEWMGWMVQAVGHHASGEHAAAADLRDRAFEAAPAVDGTLNGEPFEWLADTDHRLGPILEVIIQGKYYWVPLDHISAVKIEPPGTLRDAVWAQAEFIWANQGKAVGLIPVRYPGTVASGDDEEKLSRKTTYQEFDAGYCVGSGQRMLATDAGEFPLLETQLITLGPQDDEGIDRTATEANADG
jgi:type VI secretion system protein ImpE